MRSGLKPGEPVSRKRVLWALRSPCSQQLRSGTWALGPVSAEASRPDLQGSPHISVALGIIIKARPHLSEASKCPSKTMHHESGFLLNENRRMYSRMICLQPVHLLQEETPHRVLGWRPFWKICSLWCDFSFHPLLAGSVTLGMTTWTLGAEVSSLASGWFMGADLFYMDILKNCQIVLMKYSRLGGTLPRLKTRWW